MRAFEQLLALLGLILLSPLFFVVFILTVTTNKSSPLFIQKRMGRDKILFSLVKFRTMKPNTRSVATHELDVSAVTALGGVLRVSKIDELPQLLNVLKGEMSFVGPRPCLPNQAELIAAREKFGVFKVRPGITGLAQIRGIDMSTPQLLAQTDAEMIRTMNLANYCKYIFLTLLGKGRGDRVVQGRLQR